MMKNVPKSPRATYLGSSWSMCVFFWGDLRGISFLSRFVLVLYLKPSPEAPIRPCETPLWSCLVSRHGSTLSTKQLRWQYLCLKEDASKMHCRTVSAIMKPCWDYTQQHLQQEMRTKARRQNQNMSLECVCMPDDKPKLQPSQIMITWAWSVCVW